MRDDPLPVESVRDLLGICRALYRAELAGEGHPVRLEELKKIGEAYRTALGLAKRAPPGSLGHTAAWRWAGEATDALCKLVGVEIRAAPMVRAAALRLRNRQGRGPSP